MRLVSYDLNIGEWIVALTVEDVMALQSLANAFGRDPGDYSNILQEIGEVALDFPAPED